MVQFTDSNGNVHEFALDLDTIIEYENEHPDWSITDEIAQVSGKFRFSSMDKLARYIGAPSWEGFVNMGLGFEDLVTIFSEALKESGFPISESAD